MKTIKTLLLLTCLAALVSFAPMDDATTIYNGAKITLADGNELEIEFGDIDYNLYQERTAYVTILTATSTVQVATRAIDASIGAWPATSKVVIGFVNRGRNIRLKGTAGDVIQITHSK